MPEVFAVFGRVLTLLVIAYALLAVGAHFLSLSMIFPRPPVKYELGPDYVQLTAPDGVRIAARHWPNPKAKYTLLYLHGNYEDLGSVGEYLPQFVAAPFDLARNGAMSRNFTRPAGEHRAPARSVARGARADGDLRRSNVRRERRRATWAPPGRRGAGAAAAVPPGSR